MIGMIPDAAIAASVRNTYQISRLKEAKIAAIKAKATIENLEKEISFRAEIPGLRCATISRPKTVPEAQYAESKWKLIRQAS